VRQDEPDYKAATRGSSLQATDNATLAEWISRHPKVLQRPIVVDDERKAAVIGRPPEAVLGLLSEPAAESSAGS
jgi:arsenate reductase-like glutaredoxin family protein